MKTKALAVKYNKDSHSPVLIAKGEESFAKKIIEKAIEYDIPIYENKFTTDMLWEVDIDTMVPHDLWDILIEVYKYIIEYNENFMKEVFYESQN